MQFIASINELLTQKMGPLGPLVAVGGLGVLLILLVLPTMLKRPPDPMEKLRQTLKAQEEESRRTQSEAATLRARDGVDKLEKFKSFLEPKTDEEMTAARLRMVRAGYRSKNAVRSYHAAQFALGLGLLFLGMVYAIILSHTQTIDTKMLIFYTIGPGAAGYYLPNYWVSRRAATRQQEIINGFPDSLDMMLVCVEAGQSLDQAIIRVAKEIRAAYPSLADEFEIVSHEVKAGKDRVTVLRDMSDRIGVTDVSSFVTVLIQSATFGTSIAEALRIFSAEMRDKRVMRAEEKANKLPTKLTLGTMLFTLPPLLIILIGPSVMGISKMLGGGGVKF